MQEVDSDISKRRPKAITEVPLNEIDTVIMLFAEKLSISLFDGKRHETWHCIAPQTTQLAEAQILDAFRGIRDQLGERIGALASRT